MTDNRPCRKDLLDWINVVSFAVDDVKLFLDTHPCNKEAMEFFDEFKKQRVQVLLRLIPQALAPNAGIGSTSHGHGRKGDANICGIMRKDSNIR